MSMSDGVAENVLCVAACGGDVLAGAGEEDPVSAACDWPVFGGN